MCSCFVDLPKSASAEWTFGGSSLGIGLWLSGSGVLVVVPVLGWKYAALAVGLGLCECVDHFQAEMDTLWCVGRGSKLREPNLVQSLVLSLRWVVAETDRPCLDTMYIVLERKLCYAHLAHSG